MSLLDLGSVRRRRAGGAAHRSDSSSTAGRSKVELARGGGSGRRSGSYSQFGFAGVVWAWQGGGAAAGVYLSGYLIEKSLSIDNVFVWAVIFTYVGVPDRYQFRALFWGIFGALALRLLSSSSPASPLLERFDWVLYVFGVFLPCSPW